jgi:hypothetical protein
MSGRIEWVVPRTGFSGAFVLFIFVRLIHWLDRLNASPSTHDTVRSGCFALPGSFDIFKLQPDGNRYFIEAAQDLDAAKERVRVLVEIFYGHYIIVDNLTGEEFHIRSKPN